MTRFEEIQNAAQDYGGVELVEKSEPMNSDVADILIKDKMKIGAYDIDKIKSWNESSGYPYREPLRFYLIKETYNKEYYRIIRNAVWNNNVIIYFQHNMVDKNKPYVGNVSIDCVATLDEYWNDLFKKIYEEE